ncbi:SCO2322 family protein [Streptomyces fradiae]|uniref:SCO2322 family protein n=1 Tax=Streptomyces fradiae TaxID=1906 RepID=UPI003517D2D6
MSSGSGRAVRTGRVRTGLAAAVGAAIVAAAAAVPAHAAGSGYRYWSFWEDQGTNWTYATQGPATARPADGDTVGFRFAVSRDASDATRPSAAPDFTRICAGVEPKAGTKRVAVVIDFGRPEDAPAGERPPAPAQRTACPQIREDATAAEALAAVAKPLRYDANALLCGISGYPKQGCGEQVALPEEQPTRATSGTGTTASDSDSDSESESGGPSVGLVVGGAAVLLLGTAGVVQARRRRG